MEKNDTPALLRALQEDYETFRQAVTERAAHRPLYVKIKLSFACNLRCGMCNHWREQRQPPLEMADFMRLVDELARMGCIKIHLTGGEPLLRPDVPALVAHARTLGLRVAMTTNGTLVDKATAKALGRAGLNVVNVSIDSVEKKVHDELRGVPGTWKAAQRAVSYFRRYRKKGRPAIRINTVVSRFNYAGLAALPDFVHALGADQLNLIAVDDHNGDAMRLHRRELMAYNMEVAPRLAERALALGLMTHPKQAYPFGTAQDEREQRQARRGAYAFGWYKTHPCYMPWVHSLVDFDGQVYLCCMTREQTPPLGDLKKTTFAEIWHGAGYAAARAAMHPPRLSQCTRCDDFTGINKAICLLDEEGV